jgi:hypothetical protein
MIIKKKRIRSINKYLNYIKDGQNFYVAIPNLENYFDLLQKVGFTEKLEVGEKILTSSIGTISEFNAYGKHKKLTDLPMETVYRQKFWVWKDWGGYEHSKIVDVPYKIYPRKFITPPSEELTIVKIDSKKYLVSRELSKGTDNHMSLHIINLFLELFGECLILDLKLKSFVVPKIKKLNWQILPTGEYPWKEVKSHIQDYIKKVPQDNQLIIIDRVEIINKYKPNYIAFGKGGFDGYCVFGFPKKGLFVLESIKYGNATYVFDKNWEKYSQLTKKEIINEELHKERIIHRTGWKLKIKNLLSANIC